MSEPKKPYFEYIKEENEKLEEKIVSGLEQMLDSDKYKEYLDFCSKMPLRSLNNQILIFMQKPEATLCLGYNQWVKKFERHVQKGAKAIKIFAPCMRNISSEEALDRMLANPFYESTLSVNAIEAMREKLARGESVSILSGFKPTNVFDVSDTEGKDLPEHNICKYLEGDVKNFQRILGTLENIAGIPIEFRSEEEDSVLKRGAKGYYSPMTDSIVIKNGMSEIQTISTLVHEIAHSIMHSKDMKAEGIHDSEAVKGIKELQAESVSYMVCQRLGIETEEKTFGYIASWIDKGDKEKTIETMKEHLNIIGKCTNLICEGLEKELVIQKETGMEALSEEGLSSEEKEEDLEK